MLALCHAEMDRRKAFGVDKMTKEQYELALDENLEDLVTRMKRQAYRPPYVRIVVVGNSLLLLRICLFMESIKNHHLRNGRELVQPPR